MISLNFDYYEAWREVDKQFEGHGKAVQPGSDLHFISLRTAKELAVSSALQLQHGKTVMSKQTFNNLCGTIAAVGLTFAIVTLAIYLLDLPIFTQEAVSWTFFWGILSAAVGVLALVIRAIWEDR